jgi:hypothetical protein
VLRQRIVMVLLAVALVLMFMQWVIAKKEVLRLTRVAERVASVELPKADYRTGEYKVPKPTTGLPEGVKPMVHVAGKVVYAPRPRAADAPPPTTTTPRGDAVAGPDASPRTPTPCSLDDLTVTFGCQADVVTNPARPWARLVASGRLEGYGQVRDLPATPAGRLDLQVAPSALPPKWHLDLLAGASGGQRVGLESGAAWTGASRWGGYGLVEWQPASGGDPSAWRVHAGLRVRLK